jgi:hypothetical protein
VARLLLLLVGGILAVSCSSPAPQQSETLPIPPKQDGPTASEMATRSPALPEDLKMLELEEYPGATVVENVRLSSKDFAPDEARLELVRKSPDAPEKVVKFYEEKLAQKATTSGTGQQVVGPTKSGNYVRIQIDADGTGSKYTLNIIKFVK